MVYDLSTKEKKMNKQNLDNFFFHNKDFIFKFYMELESETGKVICELNVEALSVLLGVYTYKKYKYFLLQIRIYNNVK